MNSLRVCGVDFGLVGALMMILLLLVLAGCGSGNPEFTELPTISANPNGSVPLAALVRFTADQKVKTTLSISDGEESWVAEFGSEQDSSKGLPVVGLLPNRPYEVSVSIQNEEGGTSVAPQILQWTTPELPADPADFPPIEVAQNEPDLMEPGITILSVRRARMGGRRGGGDGGGDGSGPAFAQEYGLLLGLDVRGRVVWYYRTDARISDFDVMSNGNIVYLTTDYRAVEIDVLGNVVAEWYASQRPQGAGEGVPVDTLTFHHAVEALPSGNILVLGSEIREIDDYFTSNTDPSAPRKRQKVMGDEVVEFQRDGTVVWRWNTFDHLDPFRIGHDTISGYWVTRGFPDTLDWTHGNGLFYDEGSDTVLVSLRKQSAVLALNHRDGQIRWLMAEPSGWSDELEARRLKEKGNISWPWYQHGPSLTPTGSLLLFDNGIWQGRPFKPATPLSDTYSRAVEYSIDPERMTVQQAWTSEEAGPDAVSSFSMGDAHLLPKTGNVQVCYGSATVPEGASRQPLTLLREFTHTDPPRLVFEVVVRDRVPSPQRVVWTLFGSQRVTSLLP